MSGEALRVLEGGRAPRGWEALWPIDVWRQSGLPHGDLAPSFDGEVLIHFEGLLQPWLKEAAKRWARARLLAETAPTIASYAGLRSGPLLHPHREQQRGSPTRSRAGRRSHGREDPVVRVVWRDAWVRGVALVRCLAGGRLLSRLRQRDAAGSDYCSGLSRVACVGAVACSQRPAASLTKHCVASGSLVLRLAKQHSFCLNANSEVHRLPHHRGMQRSRARGRPS